MGSLFYIAYVSLFCLTAVSDIRNFTIPNTLVVALLGLFFFAFFSSDWDVNRLAWHLIPGCLAFAVGYILFSLRSLGGGDVKLIAVAVLWLGLQPLIEFFITMSLAGAILSIGMIVYVLMRRRELKLKERFQIAFKSKIPYGVAISIGAILAHPATKQFLS